SVLSLPDERDHMSLPYQRIEWDSLEREPGGLRMGLLMDAGFGLPIDPEVRTAVEAAATRFEAAGAILEPLAPFLAKSMSDGLDRFWRTRALADIGELPPERRLKVLPFIRAWADGAQGHSGMELFLGFSQIMVMRATAASACRAYDYVLAPTA